MSTRCQIGFYESGETNLNNWSQLLYRHSDGYPGTGKSEYGVLADIVPFLRWWDKNGVFDDLEYCSARLLQYLCNEYDKLIDRFEAERNTDVVVTEKPKFTGVLGYGICKEFHGDIEYFYAIYPNKLEVYDVPYDINCDTWKLIKTIKLATKKA